MPKYVATFKLTQEEIQKKQLRRLELNLIGNEKNILQRYIEEQSENTIAPETI